MINTLRWVWFSLVLAALPAVAYADLADEVAACEPLEFSTCVALQQAAASRKAEVAALAARLAAADTSAAVTAKLALALALLDARDHSEALQTAALRLAGKPEVADVRAAQARLGDARATPVLLELAKPGNSPHAQLLAIGSLGILRAAQAVPVLLQLVQDDHLPQVQAEAARALGAIGDKSTEAVLLTIAGQPGAVVPVRAACLRALARQASAAGAALAALLADHPSPMLAGAAMDAMGAAWQPWMTPAVLAAAAMPGLRADAAQLAARHAIAEAAPLLLSAVQTGGAQPDELPALLECLGHLKPMGAAAILAARLPAAGKAEKILLLRTLPKLGDRTVVPELVPLLQDSDNQIVSNTVYALENLTGRNLGPDVLAWRKYAGLDTAPPPAVDAAPKP